MFTLIYAGFLKKCIFFGSCMVGLYWGGIVYRGHWKFCLLR